MAEQINASERLQQNVDRLKALSLANNIHNLTPPTKQTESGTEVSIINALKANPMIYEYLLELKGLMYDPLENEWKQYRSPIMNQMGIGNFITCLLNIATSIEWSNYKEEEIPQRVKFLFRTNYPTYTVYSEDYELQREDFNIIATMLFTVIDTSLHKAKGAGHRNVPRAVYSEDFLGKAIGNSGEIRKSGSIFDMLARANPFARKK